MAEIKYGEGLSITLWSEHNGQIRYLVYKGGTLEYTGRGNDATTALKQAERKIDALRSEMAYRPSIFRMR